MTRLFFLFLEWRAIQARKSQNATPKASQSSVKVNIYIFQNIGDICFILSQDDKILTLKKYFHDTFDTNCTE